MRFLNDLLTDLRFTFRQFGGNIGFSLVVVGSIALGIGATSAIFSVVYAVLYDPYPYRDSERMINPVFTTKQIPQGAAMQYSIPAFLELRENSKTLEDAILWDARQFVATEGLAERVKGLAYSPNFFDFMGVEAMIGRNFNPGDIPIPATPPQITVISYLFWQRYFNGDPDVVGRAIELNHQPHTILGVLPPRFTWNDADVYVPLPMVADNKRPMSMMARIKPGLALGAASAELQTITRRLAELSQWKLPPDFEIHARPMNDWLLRRIQGTLFVLLAAVGCLLLIACGNVSILLLARASARQKEVAVRAALGAGRGRVIRQLLTESIVLASAGGLLGVLFAYQGVPAIVSIMPQYSVPHEAVIAVNGPVVLFSFALSVLTGTLFGLAPALQLSKTNIRETMEEGGRAMSGSGRVGRLRGALIVSEVALTMILLVGAGVAVRGLLELINTPLGYDPSNVVSVGVATQQGKYTTWQERRAYYETILERLRAAPGVQSAAVATNAQPPFINFAMGGFEISGRQISEPNQSVRLGLVGAGYFSTIRVPRLRGRDLSSADMERAEQVAVINEEMRRRYFAEGDVEGQRIRIPGLKFERESSVETPPDADEWVEVVGVVDSVPTQGTRELPDPAIYIPYSLVLPPSTTYLVRTEGDPSHLINTLRRQVASVDPDQPATTIRTLDEVLERSERAYPRFSTMLFSIFATVGLLLAATGLYSVVSYTVARRTHEFGIRMAVGAGGSDILRLAASATARLMLVGVALGLGGSSALSRLIAPHLSGWDPEDPVAYIAVTVLLSIVAIAACCFPVWRATAIDPVNALRHE